MAELGFEPGTLAFEDHCSTTELRNPSCFFGKKLLNKPIFFAKNSGPVPTEVKVHEGGEADDVVRDALDGVVVEQQPLHAAVPRALARHLQQLVAGQICQDGVLQVVPVPMFRKISQVFG